MAIRRSSIAKRRGEEGAVPVSPIKKEISYSQALREAKQILGAQARVWHNNRAQVEVGFQLSDGRDIRSTGATFREAIENLRPTPV
ncbi:hypothetical protein EBZ39_11425 [bacterium]|nr:hypothetical protein [bacterium]